MRRSSFNSNKLSTLSTYTFLLIFATETCQVVPGPKQKNGKGKRSVRFQVVFLKVAVVLTISKRRGNIFILATTKVVVEPRS